MSELKRCPGCGTEHPPTPEFFSVDKRRPGGIGSECRVCARENSRRWREVHPDRKQQQQRLYRRANLEKAKAANSEWQKNNREKTNEKTKRWQANNREQVRAGQITRKCGCSPLKW